MRLVLTLNGGSSSLKWSLATAERPPVRRRGGKVEGGAAEALPELLASLEGESAHIAAVSHRVVHGGRLADRPRRVSPELLEELRRLAPLDPDHMPAEIAIVEAAAERLPGVPQVVCFDSTFHRSMPLVARIVPVPRRFGVERCGFHGLSYTFLVEALARVAPDERRAVIAHLGSGASLAAVRDGRCVDTTMGFTPASGIPMSTRTGDLDPGVLVHLLRTGLGVDALDDLLNHRSGLLAVSESSADMRELLAREASDPRAALAVELFCYRARQAVGALAASLGGLDTLVFSGGIGEKAAPVRERIVAGLAHLGLAIDPERNAAHAPVVSPERAAATVRVIATDEEAILAREALALIDGGG